MVLYYACFWTICCGWFGEWETQPQNMFDAAVAVYLLVFIVVVPVSWVFLWGMWEVLRFVW